MFGFFTSCGGLRGLHSFLSAQWPSTLSLTTLTLTQTRSEGVEASCCAADRREAYLWPGAQSAQRRRCLLLLRGNGMSLTWNHKCDLWNADAVITCVVAVFLSVLLGKDYWNNMTAVVFCLFFFFVPQTYVFTDGEDEKLRKRIGETHTHTHICAHAHKHTQQFCWVAAVLSTVCEAGNQGPGCWLGSNVSTKCRKSLQFNQQAFPPLTHGIVHLSISYSSHCIAQCRNV